MVSVWCAKFDSMPDVKLSIVKAFDVFCGVGGLSYGLQQAGISVSGGLDSDPSCRHAYTSNCEAAFIDQDIQQVNYQDIDRFFKNANIRILVGCAPCQPFSAHRRKAPKGEKDERWDLISEFQRIIAEGKPEVVSMENVPQLAKETVFAEFVERLEELGYFVSHKILNCAEFGVPQRRSRLVLLGSLLGPIRLPQPEHGTPPTVRQSIGYLPKLKDGTSCSEDRFHVCGSLSPLNLQRMKVSTPGGSWKTWPKPLLPECYKRQSGQTFSSVYGRMEWDKPAPTLTTQFLRYGTGRYGHPEQDRALTLREGALLQTFPPNYEFCSPSEPIVLATISRHIGNAVPPRLAQKIGNSILEHLGGKHE